MQIQRALKILVFCASLLGFGAAQAAGRAYNCDFEGAGTPASQCGFVVFGNNPNATFTTSEDGLYGPRSGSKMTKITYDGSSPPGVNGFLDLPADKYSYNSEFLLRWWYREDANVDRVDGFKYMRIGRCSVLSASFPAGDVWHETYTLYTGDNSCPGNIINVWCHTPAGDGGCTGASMPLDHRWFKSELYVKIANGTGVVRRWMNDNLVLERLNLNTAAGNNGSTANVNSTWKPIHFGSNWDSDRPGWFHDANNTVYLDDIEVFTDTATGGVGNMSDGTIGQGATDGNVPPPTPPPTPPPATNVTYYVSNSGSDSNNGTSAATPFATIQRAANVTLPGDLVVVKDGTYTDPSSSFAVVNVTGSHGGNSTQPVRFISENRYGAVIGGSNPDEDYGFVIDAPYVVVEGFKFQNLKMVGINHGTAGLNTLVVRGNWFDGIGSTQCTDSSLGKAGIYSFRNQIDIIDNKFTKIGRRGPGEFGCAPTNTFWQNLDHAIYMSGSTGTIIAGNEFDAPLHGYSIQFYDGDTTPQTATNPIIRNNTFTGANPNRQGQILFGDPGVTGALITQNSSTLSNTSFVWRDTASFTNVTISNNKLDSLVIQPATSSGLTDINNNPSNAVCNSVVLPPTFATEAGFAYRVNGTFLSAPDTATNNLASNLRMFERGTEMTPAHATLTTIRDSGNGAFSHFKDTSEFLRFSTIGNATPGVFKTYHYCAIPAPVVTPTPTPPPVGTGGAACNVKSTIYGGSTTGTTFDDNTAEPFMLTGVNLRHGWSIDSIQGISGSSTLPNHGGTGGTAASFTLPANRYITSVQVSYGTYIDKLTFTDNQGSAYGPYGLGLEPGTSGTPAPSTVTATAPAGMGLVGFTGRDNGIINNLGFIWRPVGGCTSPTPSPTPTAPPVTTPSPSPTPTLPAVIPTTTPTPTVPLVVTATPAPTTPGTIPTAPPVVAVPDAFNLELRCPLGSDVPGTYAKSCDLYKKLGSPVVQRIANKYFFDCDFTNLAAINCKITEQ